MPSRSQDQEHESRSDRAPEATVDALDDEHGNAALLAAVAVFAAEESTVMRERAATADIAVEEAQVVAAKAHALVAFALVAETKAVAWAESADVSPDQLRVEVATRSLDAATKAAELAAAAMSPTEFDASDEMSTFIAAVVAAKRELLASNVALEQIAGARPPNPAQPTG